jgi:hypothetical protein
MRPFQSFRRNISVSVAKLAAMRRASVFSPTLQMYGAVDERPDRFSLR